MTNGKVTKGQRIQWLTKKLQKDIQYNDQRKVTKGQWSLYSLSFCNFSVGHCIVCPFVTFPVGHCILCPFVTFPYYHRKSYKRTDNTMTNGKVTTGHTIQWPTEKLQKDRQYNDQRKSYNRTDKSLYCVSCCNFSVGHCIVCPLVAFPVVIVLSVLL
jgi:hypothetical protein